MPGVEFGRFSVFLPIFPVLLGPDFFSTESISLAILYWNWRFFLCINDLHRFIFFQYVSRWLAVFRAFPSWCSASRDLELS